MGIISGIFDFNFIFPQDHTRARLWRQPQIASRRPKRDVPRIARQGSFLAGDLYADRLGPGREVIQDRNPFHETHRLQATVYEIAATITGRLHQEARRFLFPQVLNIVWDYLENRVEFIEAPREEIYLEKYKQLIIERITSHIEPDTEAGEPPLLPIIERFRPIGSTSEVLFRTVRPCHGTTQSHVSHVAEHSQWEHTVAYYLERSPHVISYVKNDHLDFVIPYELYGVRLNYLPDYLVRSRRNNASAFNLILEVKGFESEPDRAKETSAQRWVRAVNHHGGFGRWELTVCREPHRLGIALAKLSPEEPRG